MRISNLVGETFKEKPSDCNCDSYEFMLRGGYIRQMGTGLFSLYTPALKIIKNIEQIIRREMNKIGAQEVLFPVVMPASLWEESGRYSSVGNELLRFKDRTGSPLVLGMTHEEASVQLVRDIACSYAQYPFCIYQFQTKFRDEGRTRNGLLRVREFTMKDAYSFHTSQADLEEYYEKCYKAYEQIFASCGIPETVAVKSDSGMMGGKISHEFMLLADIGEDVLAICSDCDYKANSQVADLITENAPCSEEENPLTKIHTPDTKTIDDLCKLLGITPAQTCKAVIYQKNSDDSLVVVFARGNIEVNETKLRNHLKEEIHVLTDYSGFEDIKFGFCGPVGLKPGTTVIFDNSLKGTQNLITGANETDYHFSGLNLLRDVGEIDYVDVAKIYEGAICPKCGKKSITIKHGIEVGNIFQLGTRYSKSMGLTYTDENGEVKVPIMGCYGIGLGRLAASIIEVKKDEYGPIWPFEIAPWKIQICALNINKADVREKADKLYDLLCSVGIEVLYDDRNIQAGAMFADADLYGIPYRVIISPRNSAAGQVEIKSRDKSFSKIVSYNSASTEIINLM
ncbi:MAG: proline--tRNA ligase [Ruminococcus sp.]|jgi:prolyl-tRNA synthetase|nr:proline--tRNA ligase [Ruminococcus sp.]